MSIFKDFAPLYWAAGIPVMPLKRWNSPGKGAGKAPILNEWTQYGEFMPSEAIRGLWLSTYPDSNIGLPFGDASGLCAIDIDTEDQAQIDAIISALPPSPWKRVGKKGMGLIYRWQGQPNFKLRDGDNQSIVEFLGKGNQMVLPPSIHPQTEKPYVSDTNLWEVLDKIQYLPMDIERLLRQALGDLPGLTIAQTGRSAPLDVVPQGERDIQMVRHAGYLARVVRGIDKNTKFSLAEAMKHMAHWVENFTAHTSGDDMDPNKGVAKLVEFLLRDVEGGATLPTGWDDGLTDDQRGHGPIAAMIEKNQIQRWDYDKAIEWFDAQVMIDPDNRGRTIQLVNMLIENLAKDENFSESDSKLVINTLVERTKGKIPYSRPDLKNDFKAARRGDRDVAEDHEAIAREILEAMNRGGEVRFDQGMFWQWSGAHFGQLEEDDVYMHIAENVKGNLLARRHNDYIAITKTVAKMARMPLAKELEDGINFANGFLDTDLQLHDHSPKYGKTFTMSFNYVPERAGEAHKWLEYLEQSWGDDPDYAEKVMALQEAFAATMFGIAPKFQRAFLLHGKAGSGKTQALEVLRAMMPPSATCTVPPTLWSERFQMAPMVGKTLNVCGELPEEATIDGRAFKEIVEGTFQNTEFKGGAIFAFKPIAAQWFGSNHLPRSRDTSKGFVRRWLIFDFLRVVPQSEKIVDFYKVLIAEEREAIAAWAVQGLKRLLAQGDYTQPSSHVARLNQVARANNSVVSFLQSSDKVRATEGCVADLRAVFDQYIDFMKNVSRGYSVSYERFMQMVDELGYTVNQYVDGVGQLRHDAEGLELRQALLPSPGSR
jgi:P4 family phage/plasmid primase-like protien